MNKTLIAKRGGLAAVALSVLVAIEQWVSWTGEHVVKPLAAECVLAIRDARTAIKEQTEIDRQIAATLAKLAEIQSQKVEK